MDTAKSTADTLNLKCVTAPTSAATCAGAVQLCVWYDDQGKMIPGITMKESVAAVIADTDIIVRNCPKRLLASGIADALAKYPELEYNVSIFPLPGITETFEVSKTVAYRNYRFLLEHAAQCLEEASLKKTTPLTEDLVACLIANTGLASSLVSGVRQLAVAHKFYSAVTILFKESRDAFYHGEIVSCGMIIQFYVNGYAEGQIENLSAFLKSLGTPVCLSDLGIEPTEKNCRLIFDYLMDNGFDAPGVRKRIEQGFEAIKR